MNKQYGECGKIGLIWPGNQAWVGEREFQMLCPSGTMTCTDRIVLEDVTEKSLSNLIDQIDCSASKLTFCDVIALACTSGSFIKGVGYDEEIIRRIKKIAPHSKVTTTATAIVNSLKHLKIKNIAVGTPYISEVNERGQRFLEAHGFNVENMLGLQMVNDNDINSLPLYKVRQLIYNADTSRADAVVILCTSMKGISILDEVEEELGKPVITANQATIWECLNLLGIKNPIPGFGTLLRSF